MSKRNVVRSVVLSVAMLAVFGGMNPFAGAADLDAAAVSMDTFANPDGVNYFALCLKSPPATTAASRDVVILFNTSASQVGDYRTKALETLKGLLAGLQPNDRVRLMALDLDAVGLTDDFVAPNGKEMADALTALEGRVPLGATDMEKALMTIVGSLADEAASKNPKTVVCIGDGRSAANLLGSETFAKLTQKMVDARIPVNSYVIGARIDRQLPGALAVQTGGTVIVDADDLSSAVAGGQLAAAADLNVAWPTSVAWPAGMTEVLPKRLPPLRSDRETVVFGTYKGNGPFDIKVTADSNGSAEKLEYTATPKTSDDNNHYLKPLVELARVDGGITLPLLGETSLAEARQEVNAGVRGLGELARQAMAAGNLDNAEQLVSEALRRDPNDTEAQAIKGALAKRRAGIVPAAAAPAAPEASAPANTAAADDTADLNLIGSDEISPPPGTLAEGFEHDRRVIAQMIQAEVQNAVGQARSLMGTEPDLASQQLKLMLEKVRKTAELAPEARDQYVDSLQTALREAARRKVEVEHARQQRLENIAAGKEQAMIAENLIRNQEKVTQLMARFNSLMREGRYNLAEAAAEEARNVLPDNPVTLQANLDASLVGNFELEMALKRTRQKAILDTLYQVERSHIPFPDDPPIIYGDPEVWRQMSERRKERYSSMDLSKQGTSEKKIQDALKSEVAPLQFPDTPLRDVIDYLKDYHKIEVQLDQRALGDVGIGSDSAVTVDLKGITLRSALRLMLRPLSLTYIIKDEVLLITTPEEAELQLSTKVYPVADLVIPVSTPMMSGMGGMGGMGGGMGGMMGGGGGMGGGGMGGGMGGGGMGGMGGGGMGGMGGGGMGMFNIPRDLLEKVPPGGFQAFAVEDDLSVPPTKDDKAATGGRAGEAASDADDQPAKIDIDLATKKNADPQTVWDGYFSKNQPQPAAVRDAVRRLMNQQKFDQVIALIGASLRHKQCQPWMYEAMALALDAAGRPKAEIERAVMSAVDFADNTADLMYIGAYLSQIGLHQRALQVYRQAAAIDPVRPEPYMLGLRTARALDDLDGLKWASLGILGQAWPKDQIDVWQAGVGVAREVLDKLRAENRVKEADAFKAALDQAVARDAVAVVTWTGEADIDVLVEEPSGAVCSLRNPRTTSGGILLGDAISQADRDSYGGHSEVYVCPKGFDGTYKLLIRRVWGDVVTGKVNVEVMTHYRTADAVAVREKIDLDQDDAVVTFDLKKGRRKEPLHERQVANAIGGQLAMNRQILAQQLGSSIDPSVLQALALSRAGNANGSNTPFNVRGAVGYQPVIITLPEGANLMVTAVVSADRRYVRITPLPLFSGIGQVRTFNMASGDTSTGGGGTGGQGFSGSGGGGGFGGGGGGGGGF